jgi:hypothetical protein
VLSFSISRGARHRHDSPRLYRVGLTSGKREAHRYWPFAMKFHKHGSHKSM